ncbi:MAG: hypothetical protein JWO47_546 [Candidatus Saccharibacteria bacterium]|nr:hypothetical protein [Candidatus Saccharibacteria bacterium]
MSSIDQQFIEYIVKSLVGNPEEVKIDRRIDEKGVLLELTVDPEDLGRVIGKRGATAQSLRTLLRALGTKNEARYNLKIIDNGEPRPPRDDAGNSDDHNSSSDDHQSNDSTSSDDSAAVASNDDSSAATDDSSSSSDSGDSWSSSPAPKSKASDDLELDDEDEIKSNSDKMSKTREELNDLDDLDI